MYQALYRKWRPDTFDKVIGQPQVTEVLKKQVERNRLSHAYLFVGTRGTGKTTCARILAKAINCENPQNGNPCGECPSCRMITEDSTTDIVEMDAASNSGVDDIRKLRDEVIYTPVNLKKKVYILDEVHMLSKAAFNALLKILEEPPEHMLFILATTELNKVPATILSRCQRHSFKRIDTKTISSHINYVCQQENFTITEDASLLLANLADGGMRDALSLLDQCSGEGSIDLNRVYDTLGLAGNKKTTELFTHILNKDAATAVSLFNSLWLEGKDSTSVLNELVTLLRDIMMLKTAPESGVNMLCGGYPLSVLRKFCELVTVDSIISAIDTINGSLSSIKDIKNPKIAAELCLVTLSSSLDSDSIKSIKSRISVLEQRLDSGDFASPKVTAPEIPLDELNELYPETKRDEDWRKYYEPIEVERFAEPQPEEQRPLYDPYANKPEQKNDNPKQPDNNPASLVQKSQKPEKAIPKEEYIPIPDESDAPPENGDRYYPELDEEIDKAEKPDYLTGLFKEIGGKLTGAAAPYWDVGKVRLKEVNDNAIKIIVNENLTKNRLNKQLAKITKAALDYSGREITFTFEVDGQTDTTRKGRDINELRKFEQLEFC